LVSAVGGVLRARTRQAGSAPAYRDTVPACEVSAVPDPEVLILVERGRKIQAIKRYREMNPGVGLKQAKDVIDGL
jgi:ribosomal protein L7/L12